MDGWDNFFLAEVGASAALTGLIFVGVSINLKKILSAPRLPERALEALLMLSTVLVVSSLLLIPGLTLVATGAVVMVVGLGAWVMTIVLDVRTSHNTKAQFRRLFTIQVMLNQITLLPYIAAGIVILSGSLNGLYCLVAGVMLSFINALADAWVLLVEINR